MNLTRDGQRNRGSPVEERRGGRRHNDVVLLCLLGLTATDHEARRAPLDAFHQLPFRGSSLSRQTSAWRRLTLLGATRPLGFSFKHWVIAVDRRPLRLPHLAVIPPADSRVHVAVYHCSLASLRSSLCCFSLADSLIKHLIFRHVDSRTTTPPKVAPRHCHGTARGRASIVQGCICRRRNKTHCDLAPQDPFRPLRNQQRNSD